MHADRAHARQIECNCACNIEKETLLRLSYKRDHNGKFFIESKDYASFWFLFHMKQDVDYKVN